jgi:hypothetical protein
MKKFNAGFSLRNPFKAVDTWQEEKLSPRRGSRKEWYERSDSKKDDITTDSLQVMQMVFFETSDYKMNPGDDSISLNPQLARTFTEDDDDEFDESPVNSEEPLPRTSPHGDDESVAKGLTMEEVAETAKPSLTLIEETEMLTTADFTETEAPTMVSLTNEKITMPRIPSTGTTNL